jgi:hypothetical protein
VTAAITGCTQVGRSARRRGRIEGPGNLFGRRHARVLEQVQKATARPRLVWSPGPGGRSLSISGISQQFRSYQRVEILSRVKGKPQFSSKVYLYGLVAAAVAKFMKIERWSPHTSAEEGSMKKLLLVSLVAVLGLVPALVVAQPDKGGSTFGGDTKGTPSDNDQTRTGTSGTNSGVNTPSPSPGTVPQATTPGTYPPQSSTNPITKADCEGAGGTWNEMQMTCTLR